MKKRLMTESPKKCNPIFACVVKEVNPTPTLHKKNNREYRFILFLACIVYAIEFQSNL